MKKSSKNDYVLNQVKLVHDYVQKTFVDKGMVADWSIHNPQPDKDNPKKPANPHAHIMLTLRSLRSNGSWAPKKTSHYELDENGQKVPVIDPETGKQKLGAKNQIPTIHEGYVAHKMEREAAGSSERASFNQIVKYINNELKSLRKQIRGIIREIRNLEKGRDQDEKVRLQQDTRANQTRTSRDQALGGGVQRTITNSLSEKQQEEFSEISGYLRSVNEKLDCSLITALFADWLRRRK